MLGTFFEVKKNDGFLTKIAMQIDRDMYSVNKSTCILTALSYQLYIYIYIIIIIIIIIIQALSALFSRILNKDSRICISIDAIHKDDA